MRSISNEEKGLKRYLKNHISLNLESMVKFLITGTVALSITACGGGGGGGSSESAPIPPVVEPENPSMGKPEDGELPEIGLEKEWELSSEQIILSNEKILEMLSSGELYEKDGKYYSVIDEENKVAQEVVLDPEMGKPEDGELPEIGVQPEGIISGEQDVVLEESKESEEEKTVLYEVSNATVVVEEKTVLAVKGDESAVIYAVDKTENLNSTNERTTVVENKGTIVVAGDKSVGMASEGSSTKVINKGTINGVSEEREEKTTSVYGMAALKNGLAENEGTININGSGSGMVITEGAQGVNRGKIEVASNWVESKDNWESISAISTNGSGSLAINEGDIFVKNSGKGMEAKENSTVINKGNIEVEGHYYYETDSEGNVLREINGSTAIRVESGSTGINEGNIKTIGASNNSMFGKEETTLINNGVIDSKSIVTYIDDSGFDSNGVFVEERGIGYSFEAVIDGRENSYIENNGTILGEGSILGVTARTGSEALNTGDILITGKVEKLEDGEPLFNNEGSYMVSMSTAMRARDNATATNEGLISMVGGDAIGMDARRGSVVLNTGDIYIESSEYLDEYKWIDGDGEEHEEEEITFTWINGLRARDQSEAINNGNITLKGAGSGIRAERESYASNKGDVNLESVKYTESYLWTSSTGEQIEQESERYTWLSGMEARMDSKVENEKNIYLLGAGDGLRANQNSLAVNKGDIYGESLKYIQNSIYENSNGEIIQESKEYETYFTGMQAYNSSRIENEGRILIAGSGVGMRVENNSTAVNKGLISGEGESINGAEVNFGTEFINSEEGVIETKTTKYYTAGIKSNGGWSSGDEVKATRVENHGKIRVENGAIEEEVDFYSGASVKGIDVQGTRHTSDDGTEKLLKVDVLNTGLVHVVGDRGVGISVRDGDITNSGEIVLEGKNTTALRIDGEGKLVNTSTLNATGIGISGNSYSYNSEKTELIIENEGDIVVTGDGEAVKSSYGNYYNTTNAARGIDSNGADIYSSGNIVATGDGAYLEYETDYGTTSTSSSAAVGIYASSAGVVKNEGDITVIGDAKDSWNGAKGIYASGKSEYDSSTGTTTYIKANVENSGSIKVDGNYAKGIMVENGNLINNSIVKVQGDNTTGIYLTGGSLENSGTIDVKGDNTVGLSASGDYAINTGDILLDGKNTTAITYGGLGKLVNVSNLETTGVGISLYGGILENEGDIKVVRDGEVVKSGYENYYSTTNAARGIDSNGADIYNSGNIVATGDGAYLEYETDWGTTSTSGSAAVGIYANSAGVVKNEGDITVIGDAKDSWNGAKAIYVSGKSEYDPSTGTSIYVNANVENSGSIKVDGNYAKGIELSNADLINIGDISIEGSSSIGISSTNDYNSNVVTKIENEGDIVVTGDGEAVKGHGNYYNTTNAARGIESNGADIYNGGNIVATGNGAYLEYETDYGTTSTSSSAAVGIYANSAGVVKNEGDITVSGNSKSESNGVKGIYASGKSEYDPSTGTSIYVKANLENSGSIKVDGNYAKGIVLNDADLINTGKIEVDGISSVGISLTNSYNSTLVSKIENEGDITVTGDGAFVKVLGSNHLNSANAAIGIKAVATDIYNSGKIEVTGDAKYNNDLYLQITSGVRGIKMENPFYGGETLPSNKKIENFGEIILSGKGDIKGIEAGGADIYNEGNITINNEVLEAEFTRTTMGIDASSVKEFKNTGNIQISLKGEGKEGLIGIRLDSSSLSYPTESLFENSGDITLFGDISTGIETNNKMLNTGNIAIVGDKSTGIKSGYGSPFDAKLENEGNIYIEGNNATGIYGYTINNSGNITLDGDNSRGIVGYDINHLGKIVINGNNSYGIVSSGYLNLEGDLIMTGDNNVGLEILNGGNLSQSTTAKLELSGQNVTGVKYSGSSYAKQLNIMVNIDGSGVGVELENGNLEFWGEVSTVYSLETKGVTGILVKNNSILNNYNGYISLYGKNMIGIKSEDSSNIINGESAYIGVSGENALGIVSVVEGYSSEIPEITNDGLIIVNGNSGYDLETSEIVTGIRGFNYGYNKGIITNNGKIEVESSNDDARGIDSYGNDVINNGIISVKGNGVVGGFDTNGIRVQGQYGTVTATNNGIINVDGKGAWGMYAGMGGVAINSETGTINVSATAEGAMIASGGTAINHGTINIEAGNLNTDIKFTDEFGNEIVKSAMFATNGGTIENYGTINTDGNLTLGSSTGGNYVIGTSEDGSYGKISAKNVDINGEVTVSANITKNGFKDEYTMQNVVDAEDITLGDEFKLVSNSLLYDAEGVIDRWGNLDATLSRNDKVLSDFTTGYINDSAEIFGKYQNEESFKTLSSEAKEVIKAIDTSSLESIEKSLNSLTPTIYSNLGRQMLETTETFKAQDLVSINSLGENSYNFTFIGEYTDVDSRKGIEGYESKLTGFVGAMNFGDGTFGTIGYGHNKLDYTGNGDGKIETIHLGLNRFMSYSGLDLRVGLGGEYNFHENKRDVEILSRKAESDFDSYGVNASVEISKKLGEKTYLKPFLGLDLSHMKYDSFSEKGAKSANVKVESESYTSVTPKAGAIVGGAFGGLDVYASAHYSYELGDMEKDTMFSYEGFDGKARLVGDELESGITSLKAGVNYKMNSFVVGGAIGKNFGRRDNAFMNVSLGYTF